MKPDTERLIDQMDIRLTASQRWAFAWLEMRGKRFLVDFGYGNCELMADTDVRWFYKM